MPYLQICDAEWRVSYVGGWCLKFVQDAFGADHPYATATDAWNANYGSGNHPSELPPAGSTVPVYFSLGNAEAGHVAISLDDGSVASSTQAGEHPEGFIHPSLQNLIDTYAKYNGGCTYLGWSEYVGNIQVVKEEDMPSITGLGEQRILSWGVAGRNGTDGTENALSGEADADLSNHVGEEDNFAIANWYNSDEAKNWREQRLPALISKANSADVLRVQLADATAKTVELQHQLDATAQPAAAATSSPVIVVAPTVIPQTERPTVQSAIYSAVKLTTLQKIINWLKN